MTARLLIIDPQNDFCDIEERCALPVPGADADMHRLAAFMQRATPQALSHIIVTLDTHASVSIERTTFWVNAGDEQVAPFTEITEADVRAGRYQPRDRQKIDVVLGYLNELERQGRYRLMVWPVHCVLGTWGHNIHEALAAQIAQWEYSSQRTAMKVLKGMNPLTEAYSALRAEVPNEDPGTQLNRQLIDAVSESDLLIVAGEAASHCVAATMQHLYPLVPPEMHRRTVLLSDCMSPVTGFEAQARQFLQASRALGVRVMTSDEALRLL